MRTVAAIWALALLTGVLCAQPGAPAAIRPQGAGPGASGMISLPTVEGKLPEPLKEVDIRQNLNAQLPLDVELVDQNGQARTFGSLMRGKPVVLAFVYYDCQMLCNLTMYGLIRAMNAIPNLTAGVDYDVVAVSFDPRETAETARRKLADFAPRYRRGGFEKGAWLMTGTAENVKRLADAVGFRYSWDEATKQWAHSSGITVLTPEGKLSKYFFGVEYSARDLRLGMVEASKGRIGTPVDQLLLFCFHYDPVAGKYGMVIMTALRLAGVATVFGIIAFWIVSYYQNKRRKNQHGQGIPAFSR
jgi:protein SCO1/2